MAVLSTPSMLVLNNKNATINVGDQIPQWNYLMATALLALLPPLVIVITMQKFFVKGLTDVEK